MVCYDINCSVPLSPQRVQHIAELFFFVFVPNLVPLPQVRFRLYHVLYAVGQGGEEVYARNPLHLIYAVHKLVLALRALVVPHHISYGLRVGLQT